METQEFAALKKKREQLSILQAREEAKMESLQQELVGLQQSLAELGVTTPEEATAMLEKLTSDYEAKFAEVSVLLQELQV